MKRKKYLLLLGLLALSCTLSVCHCRHSPLLINRVLIEVPEGMPNFMSNDSQDRLRDLIRETISKSPHFLFVADKPHGGVLKLAFRANEPDKNSVFLSASLSRELKGERREDTSFADADISDQEAFNNLGNALEKALQDLYSFSLGHTLDASSFIAILEKKSLGAEVSEQELLNAIGVLGKKQVQKALEALINLMAHTEDLVIGNACLIALGEIGDQSAMEAIISYAERKPPIIRRQAILAAEKIASQLAAEWLLVMAYGHDDPAVRQQARDALSIVENRLGKKQEAYAEQ